MKLILNSSLRWNYLLLNLSIWSEAAKSVLEFLERSSGSNSQNNRGKTEKPQREEMVETIEENALEKLILKRKFCKKLKQYALKDLERFSGLYVELC